MTQGEDEERRVEAAIRAVLPAEARLYANLRHLDRERPDKPAYDGESDLVITHPEHGLLVIETKAGEPRLEKDGRWYLGDRRLGRSPFAQAEGNRWALLRIICESLGIMEDRRPRSGHAVAFPGADLRTLPRGHGLLAPDAPSAIILDAEAFESPERTRQALERAWAWWTGDGTRGHPLSADQVAAIDDLLAPEVVLHRLIGRDVDDARERLVQATLFQKTIVNQHRATRRLEVVGPAGSGKSLVAVEKARRLAREGYRTLYCCFNQALATSVLRDIEADEPDPSRRPMVATFHGLCESLASAAGTLPPKPAGELPPDWFNTVLPTALDRAIDTLEDPFHAVVIDEGQDFDIAWLTSLGFLLRDPDDGVLWVFHDPGQALFRDDCVAELGLGRIELFEDFRSPAPVAALAARFYHGPAEPYAMTETGR
ncbi:MAG: AAA family ATPase, partial [Chloroflexota bacterium]